MFNKQTRRATHIMGFARLAVDACSAVLRRAFIVLLYSVGAYALVDTADHTLQSLSRTTLREIVGTVCNHVLHALAEARASLKRAFSYM